MGKSDQIIYLVNVYPSILGVGVTLWVGWQNGEISDWLAPSDSPVLTDQLVMFLSVSNILATQPNRIISQTCCCLLAHYLQDVQKGRHLRENQHPVSRRVQLLEHADKINIWREHEKKGSGRSATKKK